MPESHRFQAVSPTQQSAGSISQDANTQTHGNDMTVQSNIAGDVMLQDHTEIFMKCMDMYQIKDSNQEQQGLETMDAVANGIEQ